MNWYREKTWRSMSGASVIGLLVFGLSLQVAPADDSGGLAVQGAASADRSASSASTPAATQAREPLSMPLQPDAAERRRSSDADTVEAVETRVHFAKIIGSSPVSSAGNAGASRAAGNGQLAEICSCDEDCDASLGDQCNIVQCIVRGVCSDDPTVPCSTAQAGGSADADCEAVNAGTCEPGSFVQRCDVVQLSGWTCETGNGFCIEDRCEDDGTGNEHSVCVPQSSGFSGSDLNPCPSQCVSGAANGLRCDRSSQCPQGDCLITSGGLCDDGTEACYVGLTVNGAIGRCCTGGACTESDETTCTGGGGSWLRYTDPEQLEGNKCICPKYGSGVSPNGTDEGSLGPVRPSGLVCQAGSTQLPDPAPIYCEDLDGDGFAPQYCLKPCVGGDNVGALCEVSNPDCGQVGTCNNGEPSNVICLVVNSGDDCGICSGSGASCDFQEFFPCPGGEECTFPGGQICTASNPGNCEDDPCGPNTTEGGCEDGFIQIGDDYSLENGSYLRLTQFRFRGGITFQNEDIIFDIWDSTGTILVDTIQVELQIGGIAAPTLNLPLTGTRDWTIEVDCYPSCKPSQLEVPQPSPVIIPPNGYVVMRSARTVGTLNGATAFWSQTDSADTGANDATEMWIDGSVVDITTIECTTDAECPGTCDGAFCQGTNVLTFELIVEEEPDPVNGEDYYNDYDSNGLPWADEDLEWIEMERDRESDETIYAGSSLNNAPELEAGQTYDTDILPGEVQVYQIPADWHQQVQVEAFFPEADSTLQEQLRSNYTNVHVDILSPHRGRAADNRSSSGSEIGSSR
ncbi:MAG: hypothetical protein IH987_08510, partial [Planctomycetes bacterium]|nr:hypothetical protein [Planctomycetota bacterium]